MGHSQCSQAYGDGISTLNNELGLDNPIEPPNGTFPQRHTDEDKVYKKDEERIDAVFKQEADPMPALDGHTS